MIATLPPINDDLIGFVGLTGGLLIAALWIVTSAIVSVSRNARREETRREIAAYVAEGSMTPDDAERILKAGRPHWERSCWRPRS